MDYGKMAYLRLDDMEARLDKSASLKKDNSVYAYFEPSVRLAYPNVYEIAQIEGGGTMSLIIKVSAQIIACGTLYVRIDGIVAGKCVFNNLGEVREIFVNSLEINDGAALSFCADESLNINITSVDVSLTGQNAYIKRSLSSFSADYNSAFTGFAVSCDEKIKFWSYEGGGYKEDGSINVGIGSKCDLCVKDGVFYLVYCDSYSNVWGVKILNGTETLRRHLGTGFSSVAIAKYNDLLVLAGVINGAVKYVLLDSDFKGGTQFFAIEAPSAAESVRFVKNCDKPSLILECGKNSYLKVLEDETAFSAALSVKITVSGV